MRRFSPNLLYVLTGPHYMARSHFKRSGRDPEAPYPSDGDSVAIYETIRQECVQAGFRTSSITASNIINNLKNGTTLGMMADLIEELSRRVADELACEFFIQLSLAEAEQFENWQKGWEDIIAKFGEITRDVEEMSKCFALSRYTAAMFHALHVAEWGAIKLGDF